MAQPVIGIAAALLLATQAAFAASPAALPDPTRPADAPALSGSPSGAANMAVPGSELQSILHVPGRKPRALLSGQWVEQGQLWGDLRVVRITPGSVILRPASGGTGAETQEMRLTPGVEVSKPVKKPAKRAVESSQ